jgi:CubicO group peptidase (beta-lactamase class C family)
VRKIVEKTGRIIELLQEGARQGVYPGAVLLVARGDEMVLFKAVGHCSLKPELAPMRKDTVFDLASLTKPLATTLGIMKLIDQGGLNLDEPLASLLPVEIPEDKRGLTPRLLLCHCSGLADWEPFYLELTRCRPEERKKVLRSRVIEKPLASPPGEGCLYSDLGFMVLEWVIEEATHMPMHLFLSRYFYEPLALERTLIGGIMLSNRFEEAQYAATENCPWRNKVLRGQVHDENAFAAGGYSGHSGLFGTAEDIYTLADMLWAHFRGDRQDYFKPRTVRSFFTRQDIVKGSSWALGWDTPSPNSSSGKHFSRNSFGHLGFTGTSIWMDLDQDVIVVFLTNRIHPSRSNEKIKAFRPRLHDVIMEELGNA